MNATDDRLWREPDAGNPHVRFEVGEGKRRSLASCLSSRAFPLYSTELLSLFSCLVENAVHENFCKKFVFIREGMSTAASPPVNATPSAGVFNFIIGSRN